MCARRGRARKIHSTINLEMRNVSARARGAARGRRACRPRGAERGGTGRRETRGPGPRGTVAHGVGYTQESFINKEKALPVYGLHLDAQLHQQFLHLVGDRAPLPQPHRLVGVSHRPGERERLVEPKL